MVYLVGAGPGDTGLITVKALDLIRSADVILYDRLVDPMLLFHARTDCILVDVGKRPDSHTHSQDEITDLLIEYGRQAKEVVRLKGGDPFLFGRGGEEAEKLHEEKIPFTIVPGVSALTAVPAYSGIPLTHRNYSSSVGVATGHSAEEKTEDPVEWKKLAAGVDTVVVFMGVGNLEYIVGELIKGGKSPETPAALIERGTTPLQRTVTATLTTIAEKAKREGVNAPALLVVGETVLLHDKLGWYQPGPLAGLRIGITRPITQSKGFAIRLSSLGAKPILIPTIATEENLSSPEVKKAIDRLGIFDFIIFSSAHGVDAFFKVLDNMKLDARSLGGKMIGVIGPMTGEALKSHGIKPDICASTFIAEGLLKELLSSSNVKEKKFLLVRSDIGRTVLSEGLRNEGAYVEDTAFYITKIAELSSYSLIQIKKGALDIITFTSSSTVHCFFKQIDPDEIGRNTIIASIGPQTSKTLLQYGITSFIEAEEYTTEGLVKAILSAKTKK
jgi:uroporphyrinogen III methyltransferase / synthase